MDIQRKTGHISFQFLNELELFQAGWNHARPLASGILQHSGHRLENLVFLGLRRSSSDIFYGKTRTGREVDFVVPSRTGTPLLVQVCESLADPQTKHREVAAMEEAMEEQNVRSGILVTRNDSERLKVRSGMIDVVPVWRFLLDRSAEEESP